MDTTDKAAITHQNVGVAPPFCIQFSDITTAIHRARNSLRRTPLQRAHIGPGLGIDLYYKLENMHWTGSFKERGALNALLNLTEEERVVGVIAASAGNHALALAYHGKRMNIPVTVVMPVRAPLTKVSQCRGYGAIVHIHGAHIGEAREHAFRILETTGAKYINGFDAPDVIAGAGTVGLEIMDDLPDGQCADAIIVPVGGAGLLAGVSLALHTVSPRTEIIAVESINCPSYTEALKYGKPHAPTQLRGSLADGLAVPVVGSNAFRIARTFVQEENVVLVSERDIAMAIVRMIETEKIVTEGAGVVGLAALLANAKLRERLQGKRVVVCICGGNIDITVLGRVIERGLFADGRIIQFDVAISDSPGGLNRLTGAIAEQGASIKDIMQERPYITDVTLCSVHVTVEVLSYEHGQELLSSLKEKGFPLRILTDKKWSELNNHMSLQPTGDDQPANSGEDASSDGVEGTKRPYSSEKTEESEIVAERKRIRLQN